eukprot:1141549-Pelagomonas_calceolata.AAC.1
MLLILTQVAAVTPHVLALIVAFGSISPVFMSTTRFVVQCTMSFYQWIPAQHVCSQCAAAGINPNYVVSLACGMCADKLEKGDDVADHNWLCARKTRKDRKRKVE